MQYSTQFTRPLISGWIGHGNFGDELMAEILRQYLYQSYGAKEFTYYKVGSRWSSIVSAYKHNIRFIHNEGVSGLRERIRNFFMLRNHDALFFGGGSILHSNNSIMWKHRLLKSFRDYSPYAPAAALGVSLGPFRSADGHALCAQFLEDLDLVVFRDNKSVEVAKNMGVSTPIYNCGDIALLSASVTPAIWKPERTEKDVVGFMLLSKKMPSLECQNFKTLLHAINITLKKGKRVRLFTFYVGEGFYDDCLNRLLMQECNAPERVELITFSGHLACFLRKISECEKIVSMRFHGLITAFLFSIPFMSITYHPKNIYFMDDINYPQELQLPFESMTAESVDMALEQLMSVEKNLWLLSYQRADIAEIGLDQLNAAFREFHSLQ